MTYSQPTTPHDQDQGSTTPPPAPGHPPALSRMASVGNVQIGDKDFDIVKTYNQLLTDDPELSMPVAAIESLISLLHHSRPTTFFETLDLLSSQSLYLKSAVPNSISLSAGTDLFQRYIISTFKTTATASGDSRSFDSVRQHLVSNGRLFVARAKASRDRIAVNGSHFVRDGTTILTHGGSRVVGALLSHAAEGNAGRGAVRFKVIYVMNGARVSESKAVVVALRAKGVPVATITEGAVAYAMGKVDVVIVGAEGVVENGGIISRLGTYQIAILAKEAGRPFYVVAESHKFVRLYPLGQFDLPVEQTVLDFKTGDEIEGHVPNPKAKVVREPEKDYFDEKFVVATPKAELVPTSAIDAVDFTPPHLISALVTESGVLTPSAVSEELINIYY